MKLQPRTLDKLTGVSTSDGGAYPYRHGFKIIAFFNGSCRDDSYVPSFGSPNPHTREKLDALNGMPRMRESVLATFDVRGDPNVDPKTAVTEFNPLMNPDGDAYQRTRRTVEAA